MSNGKGRACRRKVLLATASASSALVGFSGSGVAANGDRRSKGKGRSNGNRPSNDELPPAARDRRPDELPIAEGEIPDEWIDEDGDISIPETDLDQFGVEIYDRETGAEIDDIETQVVSLENDEPLDERGENNLTIQSIPSLRGTIWEYTEGDIDLRLKGGFTFNVSGPDISVDLSFEAMGVSFEVVSFGVRPDEERTFCIEPQVPPQLPLSVAVCPDFEYSGGSELRIGGSGEACIGVDCPWFTCEFCRSIGFGGTVDFEKGTIDI